MILINYLIELNYTTYDMFDSFLLTISAINIQIVIADPVPRRSTD